MSADRTRPEPQPDITFDGACAAIEAALSGTSRHEIVAGVSKSKSFSKALSQLRDGMRSHRFQAGGNILSLDAIIQEFDQRTRLDGFHVLHDWDGTLDELNEETIPVDVLNFMMDKTVPRASESHVLAILLDYYFLYVLALLTLRVWDEGDPNDNLDRLSRLLGDLQGSNGSGQKFADGAEVLVLVAVSHFEPDVSAYDRLLARVQTLDRSHRESFALIVAGIYASHLRFGFEATYGRDIIAMRNDNAPDYPWLLFALVTLMEAYAGLHDHESEGVERERVVEGILNGLSPDPRAFVGKAPDSLASYREEHSRFRELFEKYRSDLLVELEHHRPTEETYSPLAFYFNFLHNILKAIVVDALLRGEAWTVALNDLLTGFPQSTTAESSEALARTLMSHARSSPDRIRGRWVPVIVYDPRKGRRAYTETIRRLTSSSFS